MTAQNILEFLQDDMNNAAEDDKIWRAINTSVRRIVRTYPWSWLRRNITVTTSDDATQGFLMPADMVDVIDPLDDGNGIVYERIDAAQRTSLPTEYKQYYFFDAGILIPLVQAEGVNVNKYDTALSFNPALPAGDYTGEFIRLTQANGQDAGVHKMASNVALELPYMGDRINGGAFIIRPSTAKRISFTDYTNARIGVETSVNYWVYPEILIAPEQEIPDVWEIPLRELAAIELTTRTYDKKAEDVRLSRINQYKMELAEAQTADGKAPMVDLPRDNTGQIRSMGWRNRNDAYRIIRTAN
jgi:hypothetical protein